MPRVTAQQLLRFCGLLLSAVALVWIALRFARSGALDLLASAEVAAPTLVVAIAILALGYALAMGLLALAWWRLVSALSPRPPPRGGTTTATYAVSQYGKYLPGNVAHYALRHAWSRREGVPHAALVLAAIIEAALLLAAALTVTLLGDLERLRLVSVLDPRLAIPLLALMLAALGVALHIARRMHLFERHRMPAPPRASVLIGCAFCYLAFMIASAGLLAGLAHALAFHVDSFAMLLAASAASWVAGFVVVGAPGGLGVREATFVALAGPALGEDRALLLIGLFRVVTFLGDTLFLAAGTAVLRLQRNPAP